MMEITNIIIFLITGIIAFIFLRKQHKKDSRYFNNKVEYTAKEKKILAKFKKEYNPIKSDPRLASREKDQWELEDIAKSETEIIYDNPLPTNEEKHKLKTGDLVKLKFMTIIDDDTEVERMWVKIDGFEDGLFSGQLENEPYGIQSLKEGQRIWFHPNHIFEIENKD